MKSFFYALSLLPLLGLAVAQSKPVVPGCTCEEVFCIQSFPESCYCANDAKLACWNKCGGPKPALQSCPPKPVTPPCECEQKFCAQIWPQSCYCANANKQECYAKCGGVKPELQKCPPLPSLTVRAAPTPTPKKSCGGFRLPGTGLCAADEVCIDDPASSGCGMACDQPGICVKKCGGLKGGKCPGANEVCVDDPNDECDPTNGGADCIGYCTPKFCGGFAANLFKCPKGFKCIDNPKDECDPKKGGADCGGICV